jgi:hypothetical protein
MTKYAAIAMVLTLATTLKALAAGPTLPNSCGDDKVRFEVKAQKGQTPALTPVEGKALIVLVENYQRQGNVIGKPTTRVGLDGAWVGANQGNSYFTLEVTPGEHHLCTDWQSISKELRSKVGLLSFTAEAGKVYYFETRVDATLAGDTTFTDLQLSPVDEDEGQYRVKAGTLSKATPKS